MRGSGPVKLIVDLPGAQKMLELLEAGVGAKLEHVKRHVDSSKEFV